MKLIDPVAYVEGTHLVSTTATESESAWVTSTSYSKTDLVLHNDKIYYCDVAHTSGSTDEPGVGVDWETKWTFKQPDNQIAMFDGKKGTATTDTTTLTVVLDTGFINSIGLMELVGDTLSVTATDGAGGPTVYSNTGISLDGSVVTDWYDYFFAPFLQLENKILTDLPPYSSLRVTVTITGTGTVECGLCKFGQAVELASTRFGFRVGIIDYSRKDKDVFGEPTLIERASASEANLSGWIDKSLVNRTFRTLDRLRADPTIYFVDETDPNYDFSALWAFPQDFGIVAEHPRESLLSIKLEGII